jgi:methyl-accepting chemotaxis protein
MPNTFSNNLEANTPAFTQLWLPWLLSLLSLSTALLGSVVGLMLNPAETLWLWLNLVAQVLALGVVIALRAKPKLSNNPGQHLFAVMVLAFSLQQLLVTPQTEKVFVFLGIASLLTYLQAGLNLPQRWFGGSLGLIFVAGLMPSLGGPAVWPLQLWPLWSLILSLLILLITLRPLPNGLRYLTGYLQSILVTLVVLARSAGWYCGTLNSDSLPLMPLAGLLVALMLLMAQRIAQHLSTVIKDGATQIETLADTVLLPSGEAIGLAELDPILISGQRLSLTWERRQDALQRQLTDSQAETTYEREAHYVFQKAIERYVQLIEKIGAGDLTVRLPGHPENQTLNTLSNHINGLAKNLAEMTTQINHLTENILQATEQILISNANQIHNVNEQAASISQITSTIDQFKTISADFADRAQVVVDQVKSTRHVSENGQQAVTDTLKAINQIREKVNYIADSINSLTQQTQQIGEITTTVNAIASQSNLLALNASIEAIRAGESGQGFAVVATEIRNLARQSKQAIAQINLILEDIQRAANAAVSATNEGNAQVKSGVAQTRQAGATIEQLNASVIKNADTAQQIVDNMQQQNSGISQIASAMQNINQAAQKSEEAARQTQRTIHTLSNLVEQMQIMIEKYKVD